MVCYRIVSYRSFLRPSSHFCLDFLVELDAYAFAATSISMVCRVPLNKWTFYGNVLFSFRTKHAATWRKKKLRHSVIRLLHWQQVVFAIWASIRFEASISVQHVFSLCSWRTKNAAANSVFRNFHYYFWLWCMIFIELTMIGEWSAIVARRHTLFFIIVA